MRRVAALAFAMVLLWACTMDFGSFQFGSQFQQGGSGPGPGSGGGTGGDIFTGGFGPGGDATGGAAQGGAAQGGDAQGGAGGQGGDGGMGGANPTNVLCDDQASLCDTAGDAKCCLPYDGALQPQCLPQGNCPANHTTVECDGPGDCPMNQDCCGTFMAGEYTTLQCSTNCGAQVIICDTTADCNGNDTCQGSIFLPTGYQVCL